jgi:tetratricopeptide (TPR) repeat protein
MAMAWRRRLVPLATVRSSMLGIVAVNARETMSRWLGAILLATFTAWAASGPAAAQINDLGALDRQFRELYGQGKYADAATVGERVLQLTEQAQGPNGAATAAALNNLGLVHQAQGRYEEVLKAYGRALAIYETALGAEHPDVGRTLNDIAIVYQAQGRYDEAFQAHGRALAIRQTALGAEHPTWRKRSTTLPSSTGPKAATRRRSRPTAGRWRSMRRCIGSSARFSPPQRGWAQCLIASTAPAISA